MPLQCDGIFNSKCAFKFSTFLNKVASENILKTGYITDENMNTRKLGAYLVCTIWYTVHVAPNSNDL